MEYLFNSTKFDGTLEWLNVRAKRGKFEKLDKANTYVFHQGPRPFTESLIWADLTHSIMFVGNDQNTWVDPAIYEPATENYDNNGTIVLLKNIHETNVNPQEHLTVWSVDISEFANRPNKQGIIRVNLKANFKCLNNHLDPSGRFIKIGLALANNLDFIDDLQTGKHLLNWEGDTHSLSPILYYVGVKADETYYVDTDFSVFVSADTTEAPWSWVNTWTVTGNKWYMRLLFRAIGNGIAELTPYTIDLIQAKLTFNIVDATD